MTNNLRPSSAKNRSSSSKPDISEPNPKKQSRPGSATPQKNRRSQSQSNMERSMYTPYGKQQSRLSMNYLTTYGKNNDWLTDENIRNNLFRDMTRSRTPSTQNAKVFSEYVYYATQPGSETFLRGGKKKFPVQNSYSRDELFKKSLRTPVFANHLAETYESLQKPVIKVDRNQFCGNRNFNQVKEEYCGTTKYTRAASRGRKASPQKDAIAKGIASKGSGQIKMCMGMSSGHSVPRQYGKTCGYLEYNACGRPVPKIDLKKLQNISYGLKDQKIIDVGKKKEDRIAYRTNEPVKPQVKM